MKQNRYHRQIILPEVGLEGQKRLKEARVLIVGVGGLGAPCAMYLAGAGVGTVGIVDDDTVALTNLHRQVLYVESDVGKSKVGAAASALSSRNQEVAIESYCLRLDAANAPGLVSSFDIVIDGTDNLSTRYALNAACVALGKPLVHASVHRFQGQISVFCQKDAPCYSCLFPNRPEAHMLPSCNEAGVLGVVPGQLALLQATEALKLILGVGETLVGRLLTFDSLTATFQEFKLAKDQGCLICGSGAAERRPADFFPKALAAEALLARLRESEPLQLIDVREKEELASGIVSGSKIQPLSQGQPPDMPEDAPIVLICESGQRAWNVAEDLCGRGFHNVFVLKGGLKSWRARGLPLETVD